MSAENAQTINDLVPVGRPCLDPQPVLRDVREGRVVALNTLSAHELFICTIPLPNEETLFLKGKHAQIASLFGDIEDGGVVSRATIGAFLNTSSNSAIDTGVRRVGQLLHLVGADIQLVDDETGFRIQSLKPSDVSDIPRLQKYAAESVFIDVRTAFYNPKPVIIFGLSFEENYARKSREIDRRLTNATRDYIQGLEGTPKLSNESGHRKSEWAQERGRGLRGSGTWRRSPGEGRRTRGNERWWRRPGKKGWVKK